MFCTLIPTLFHDKLLFNTKLPFEQQLLYLKTFMPLLGPLMRCKCRGSRFVYKSNAGFGSPRFDSIVFFKKKVKTLDGKFSATTCYCNTWVHGFLCFKPSFLRQNVECSRRLVADVVVVSGFSFPSYFYPAKFTGRCRSL